MKLRYGLWRLVVAIAIGALFITVLLVNDAAGETSVPSVDVTVGVNRSRVDFQMTVSGFAPNTSLYRLTSYNEYDCLGQQTTQWVSQYIGTTDAYGNFFDAYVTAACSGTYTFTYSDFWGNAVQDTESFDRSELAFRTTCAGLQPEWRPGDLATLSVAHVSLYPWNPESGRNSPREIPVGTPVVIVFGPSCGEGGVYYYYVRTQPENARYDQMGWAPVYDLANLGVGPRTPQYPLSSVAPQARVSEGSLRANLRSAPTVRQVDGSYVASVLTQIRTGETVDVLGQTSNGLWFKVRTASGYEGWTCSNLLPEINFDTNWLPNNHPDGLILPPVQNLDPGFPQEDCFGNVTVQ